MSGVETLASTVWNASPDVPVSADTGADGAGFVDTAPILTLVVLHVPGHDFSEASGYRQM
jgi:hypothetical protein